MYFKQIILVLTVTVLVSCNNSKENNAINENKGAKHTVEVLKIENTSFDEQINYSGFIEPKVTIPLSFLVPGTVVAVHIEEGDKVSKGQILAELNKTTANNTYQGTLATLNQATDAYKRFKEVYDKGSLPEIQMQDIISKLEQAKAANKVAYQNLSNCTLKATESGFIGSRNIEVGSNTIPGNPIMDLVTLNEVYVKIAVPENEINKISKGQKATIVIAALGSKEFEGEIEKVGVIANKLSKTYEVKILIPNNNLFIKSGMACNVNLKMQASESRLTIPYRAVIKDENDKNYVFKVNLKSKTVSKQFVELGTFSNNQIEIKSGLSNGDLIVTEGHHQLLENDQVKF